MRIVPTLTFIPDALPENARALDEVLARAKALDEEVAARRGTAYAGEEDPYKKPREEDDLDSDDDVWRRRAEPTRRRVTLPSPTGWSSSTSPAA